MTLMPIKSKKGAMEMSVGTIVTIVLLMAVLVLGLTLVRQIFSSSTSAIDTVDGEVQNQINQLFGDQGNFVIYPASQQITLNKKDNPKGFAFSVKNPYTETREFRYTVEAQDVTGCGSLTIQQANSWLRPSKGEFSIGAGNRLSLAEIILFILPESAPPCTITYRVKVMDISGEFSEGGSVFVTIK